MKPFSYYRTRRNTTFVVLFVWLFALASGVANACLIQADDLHGHGSLVAHSSAVEKGYAISAVHGDVLPDHDSGLEASKSQCLKVCDDGSQSLPKQQVSSDLTHPVLAPLIDVAWTTAMPVFSTRDLAVFQRLPYPSPPIRIRFSRLAL